MEDLEEAGFHFKCQTQSRGTRARGDIRPGFQDFQPTLLPESEMLESDDILDAHVPASFSAIIQEDVAPDNCDENDAASSVGFSSSEVDTQASDGDDQSDPSDYGGEEQEGLFSSSEDEEDEMFNIDEILNHPLCDGVETTRAEALLMVMSFVMRYALSTAALVGLLQLINELFGKPVLVATRFLCQKIFKNRLFKFSFHFYCQCCYSLVGTYEGAGQGHIPCPQCDRPCSVQSLSNGNFFVTTNLRSQIKSLFELPDIARNLTYRYTRIKCRQDGIEDIYDGEIYKMMSRPGQPLANEKNFSYSFNSDGTPIFKSSKYSLWPIYLMINELPPRMRRDNLIVAGVWFGKSEPKMNIFLEKFVTEANLLITEGISWKNNGQFVHSELYGISCNVDAPARATMKNTVQFNGYMGCGLCYHPGVSVERTVKYPVDVCDYSERTDDELLHDMMRATDEGHVVRGVKGPTPLINLPHFSIVWGFPVDFMHCVLLGVIRQLTELWIDSPAGSPFYIGSLNNIAYLDSVLKQVKLPSFTPRTQRPISERKFWKASEWYNWLLFLSLPCLLGILPHAYFIHICSLIEAVFLLLQKSVSEADVNRADILLYSFVAHMQLLYGRGSMTFNIHSLTHLPKGVKMCGPLWTHSCFPFETANGKIKALLHGNRGIIMQTLHKFLMIKSLHMFKLVYGISDQKKAFCEQLLLTNKFEPSHVIGEIQLYGVGHMTNLSPQEMAAIQLTDFIIGDEALAFNRMSLRGLLFHTVHYQKSKTRNNTVIFTDRGKFGVLQRIICTSHNECVVLLKEICVAPVNVFSDGACTVSHIKKCVDFSDHIHVVNALGISGSCIIIKVRNSSYVCLPPSYVTM
ncbi:uncharacterized protein LOC110984916 isoform X2 [Acanthaster planci]|uniref:Uncharacterized protein LOC110984916 isoform X2 n=1 Tax=Acanthaster planci TaxID=133434 RepID=A0A8B7Z6H7_ACAPL|nr:uncharacterized protein LOC110984916 isoform X2 [Acanthaster planci]